MLWHVTKPLDAGRLVGRVRSAGAHVNAAGDHLVDDRPLLLLQQRDQLLLGADVAVDAACRVIEEAGDGSLFGEVGWLRRYLQIVPSLDSCDNGDIRDSN